MNQQTVWWTDYTLLLLKNLFPRGYENSYNKTRRFLIGTKSATGTLQRKIKYS